MPLPDVGRAVGLSACIGAGVLLARCLVFNGKSATLPDAVDSGTADSSEEPIAPDPGVRCGANEWCSGGAVCCQKLGSNGWFGPSSPCGEAGTCANFSQFACDTVRECADGGITAGESCCATRESETTEFQGSSCVPAAACAPPALAVALCAPGDPTACPPHQSCVAADGGDLPPGYYACR